MSVWRGGLYSLGLLLAAGPLAGQDRYADPQGRFSITIPPGWEASSTAVDAVTISNGMGQLTLLVPGDGTADSLLQDYLEQYSDQWTEWKELRREPCVLGGANGTAILGSGRNPRGVLSWIRIAAADTPTGPLVALSSAPQERYTSIRPTLEGIEGGIVLNARTRPQVAGAPTPSQPTQTRAFLGVGTRALDLVDLRRTHVGDSNGALVGQLYPGGPAEEAGIVVGDIIVAVDGQMIESPQALIDVIARHRAGDGVVVGVWREGRRGDVRVQLTAPPER